MRNPLNQKVQSLQSSGIRRFFSMAAGMKDVISLGVGEPDFDTPWHIREEAIHALQEGLTFYSANAGIAELREAITKYNQRKYHISYQPDSEVLVTVGCSEAIDLVMRVMLDPGDEVIIVEPAYVSYVPCIRLADGVPVIISAKEENKFRLTAEELEAAITPKTKLLLISYPNNPTGAIMTKEDLEAIAEVVKKHDIFVVSDEIYAELTYTGQPHCSMAAIDGMRERTILLSGFSKAFAMTGWRLGYVLAPSVIIEEMIKIHQYTVVAPATFAQYAAIDAMYNSDEDVQKMVVSYNQRRRYLLSCFADMGLPCFEPEGAFYLFPNIKQFQLTSEAFAAQLLQEEKLAVVPGSSFGECGEGYIRISYAYSLDELQEAMIRLERFITRLKTTK